jgi:hypothetical protein
LRRYLLSSADLFIPCIDSLDYVRFNRGLVCGSLCIAEVLEALLYGWELCVGCGIKAAQAVWLGGEIHMSGNATNQELLSGEREWIISPPLHTHAQNVSAPGQPMPHKFRECELGYEVHK